MAKDQSLGSKFGNIKGNHNFLGKVVLQVREAHSATPIPYKMLKISYLNSGARKWEVVQAGPDTAIFLKISIEPVRPHDVAELLQN